MGARRMLWVLTALLLLGLAGWWWGSDVLRGPDVLTVPVARGQLEITLTVTGELEAVNSVVVTAPADGGNKKIISLAQEGSRVKEGDVVVAFDTTDFEKDVRLAENEIKVNDTRIQQQEANGGQQLAQLDSEIARARIAVERASLTLTDSETVARIERERARLSVEEANLSLEKLQADRVLKEQSLVSDARLLELEREKLMSRLEVAQRSMDSCVVRAPTSGLVLLSKAWKGSGWGTVEEGDSVWPGQTVLEIPDLSSLQTVVQVHEVDAGLIKLGQQASLSLDAFPGPNYPTEVSQIANLATTIDRGSKIKYFRTVLKILQVDETMKPGMTTRVVVAVETLDDVINVPLEATFEGPDGPQVFVREAVGFAPRRVELGKRNATHVVVLDGLKEGEVIALTDPTVTEDKGATGTQGDGPSNKPDGA